MYLSFELWNHILYFLDTKELYNISLTNNFFNQLSREIIEKRFKKFKNKYIEDSINVWKEYVLIDKYPHDFYNHYLGSSNTTKEFFLNNAITNVDLKNITIVLNKICDMRKKWLNQLDSKIIVFLLREWCNSQDYNIKKLIIDYRIPFKERINNLDKYNIFYLNCYYNYLMNDLDTETINLIKLLP